MVTRAFTGPRMWAPGRIRMACARTVFTGALFGAPAAGLDGGGALWGSSPEASRKTIPSGGALHFREGSKTRLKTGDFCRQDRHSKVASTKKARADRAISTHQKQKE